MAQGIAIVVSAMGFETWASRMTCVGGCSVPKPCRLENSTARCWVLRWGSHCRSISCVIETLQRLAYERLSRALDSPNSAAVDLAPKRRLTMTS